MPDRKEKLNQYVPISKEHKLDAVVLHTRANFAWLTTGGDSHVVSQSELGFAALVVTVRSVYLLTTNIEAERFANEEPVADYTIKSYPWTGSLDEALLKLLGSKKAVADVAPVAGLPPLQVILMIVSVRY